MRDKLKLLGSCCLVVMMAFSQQACESSDDDDSTAQSRDYNGPGSKWDVSLEDDGTFQITRRPDVSSAIDMTVNGDYERLGTGFVRLVVDNASGTDAPDPGDEAWALEVEGYAFMLKPVDSDQMIPMVNAGTCPDSDFLANWVLVKKANTADATDAGRDFFGSFSFTASNNESDLPGRYALDNNFTDQGPPSNPLGSGTCDDGIMVVGGDAEMFLTDNGGAIVHTNINTPDDSSFIFALNQKAISNIDTTDADYAGLLFDEDGAVGEKIKPVSVDCEAGVCNGTIVTDIVNGTLSAESVVITLGTVDDLEDGFVTGTITSGSGTGNLACMADINVQNSSQKIISCVGQSPEANTEMFNIILVSI